MWLAPLPTYSQVQGKDTSPTDVISTIVLEIQDTKESMARYLAGRKLSFYMQSLKNMGNMNLVDVQAIVKIETLLEHDDESVVGNAAQVLGYLGAAGERSLTKLRQAREKMPVRTYAMTGEIPEISIDLAILEIECALKKGVPELGLCKEK